MSCTYWTSYILHDNRYECAINIEDLIKLSDVMAEHSLGPNGGMTIILSMFHLCLNVLGFRHFRHPVVWSLFMKVHLLVQVTLKTQSFLHVHAR